VKKTQYVPFYLALAVALTTFIVYLPSLRNQFIEWDDIAYICENFHIRSLNEAFFHWAFLDFYASNWYPLTWISHALDYAIWGLNPLGHHLTSIFLHAVNTMLVVLLVKRILEAKQMRAKEYQRTEFINERPILISAGLTGLLFGLHPLHVESVAWVSERKDVLCAFFFLLSIIKYTDYTVTQIGENASLPLVSRFTRRSYLFSLGLFALALMSKPMAVTLPVVLLILDWYPFNRFRSLQTFRTVFFEKLPFFVLAFLSSLIAILAQRTEGALSGLEIYPLSARLLIAAKSLMVYLWRMILPLNLAPFYPYPKNVSILSIDYILPLILVVGLTIACIVCSKKEKGWLAVWGYYVVTLVPVLGIIQVGAQSMADRYTYLPSLGPFLMAGSVVSGFSSKLRKMKGLSEFAFSMVVTLILCLPLIYLTKHQINIWQNSITFWNYELGKEPDATVAYLYRGISFMKSGRYEQATEDFNRAISLSPTDYHAFLNRGILYEKLNLSAQAINDFNTVITMQPLNYHAYAYRGMIFDRMRQPEKALADFDMAVSINPKDPDGYYNRGLFFAKVGQLERALADYDKALFLNPNDPDTHYHRGLVFERLGVFNKALEEFNKAISLNPSYYQVYYSRGLMFQRTGQFDEADRDLTLWKEYSSKQ
jgi:tetratricopeptide (TPR) repeat protein